MQQGGYSQGRSGLVSQKATALTCHVWRGREEMVHRDGRELMSQVDGRIA